ncbi:MAG: biopolymer transporter ExbD [Halobacteriovoraceae bacterium]|nr:biopolymer transporter ExbD [Halobacteriovoraceae bacterium]
MRNNKLNKPPKINVIPILDAVFIFVFFLLMSAQFVDLYELHTAKPKIEEVSSENSEEMKSQNLKLKLYNDKIVLTKGLGESSVGTYGWDDDSLEKLGNKLLSLKLQYPKESSIIIKPHSTVKYKKIVQAADVSQKYYKSKDMTGKLFKTIAFEPMD